MQKVKVTRYVTGKRPLYAPDDEESSDEETTQPQQGGVQDEEEDEVVESTPAVDVVSTNVCVPVCVVEVRHPGAKMGPV